MLVIQGKHVQSIECVKRELPCRTLIVTELTMAVVFCIFVKRIIYISFLNLFVIVRAIKC